MCRKPDRYTYKKKEQTEGGKGWTGERRRKQGKGGDKAKYKSARIGEEVEEEESKKSGEETMEGRWRRSD